VSADVSVTLAALLDTAAVVGKFEASCSHGPALASFSRLPAAVCSALSAVSCTAGSASSATIKSSTLTSASYTSTNHCSNSIQQRQNETNKQKFLNSQNLETPSTQDFLAPRYNANKSESESNLNLQILFVIIIRKVCFNS